MIRVLSFFALGAAVALGLITSLGVSDLQGWSTGFGIAAAVLFVASLMLGKAQQAKEHYVGIQRARTAGRVRAALVLHRRETGTYLNEQPEVEFTLLVDRHEGPPFRSQTRQVISILDAHETARGSLVAVAHPDPEFGNVYLVDDPVPHSTQFLSAEAAHNAPELPHRRATNASTRPSVVRIVAATAAFLVGAIVIPLLVHPNLPAAVSAHMSGETFSEGDSEQSESPNTIGQDSLFDIEALFMTIDVLIYETGHDETFSLYISDTTLTAEVPIEVGSDKGDSITVRHYEVTERRPMTIQPDASEDERFLLFDIDWEGVYAFIPEARDIAVDRGLTDAELQSIRAELSSSDIGWLEITLNFSGDYGNETVGLSPDGELLPSEQIALLPEEERETYLFDPEAFQEAVDEIRETVDIDRVIEVNHWGDRFEIEGYREGESGVPLITTVEYRNGRIESIEEEHNTHVKPEEVFALDDLDWAAILGGIPELQSEMAAVGIADAQPAHFVAQNNRVPLEGTYVLTLRLYFDNEAGLNGSVEVDANGSVLEVDGP